MSIQGPYETRVPGRFVATEIGVTHPEATPRLATYTVARDGGVTGTVTCRAVNAGPVAAAAATRTKPAKKPAARRRRRRRTPARTASRTTGPSGGSDTRARSSMSRSSARARGGSVASARSSAAGQSPHSKNAVRRSRGAAPAANSVNSSVGVTSVRCADRGRGLQPKTKWHSDRYQPTGSRVKELRGVPQHMAQATAQIGVTGLGVMGRNLARNFARHGYTVALHNRTVARMTAAGGRVRQRGQLRPGADRRGVRAGPGAPAPPGHHGQRGRATDAVIDEFAPLLERGRHDHRRRQRALHDTRRREAALREQGLHFVGMGVSGGEEGALNGPSHHARRLPESYAVARPDARDDRARTWTARPCCTHIGPDGAGHFVKMVHNGIEYADMQLIAEAYDLLRHGAGFDARADRRDLPDLEHRPPGLLPDRDHRRGAGPHRRGHRPAVRGHRRSTRPSRRAPAAGPCRSRSTWASRSTRHRRGSVRPVPVRPRRPAPGRPDLPGPARETGAGGRVRGPGRAGPVRLQDRLLRPGLAHDRGRQRGVRLEPRPGPDRGHLARRLHHPGRVPGPDPGRLRRPAPNCRRCWPTTSSARRSPPPRTPGAT